LHGDERGSVDRRFYNSVGSPKIAPDPEKVSRKASQLKQEPFRLDARHRRIVENAIKEVCRFRGYDLIAINVRTNHVHLVVSNSGRPERMMDSFKAYATQALRAEELLTPGFRPWSRHGSTKYLWTDDHIVEAVDYVVNGQGAQLPTFDRH
jgi:REP element-mobilizing transposase RayT